MIYFKNAKGEVFAYENGKERDEFGASDLVRITEQEAKVLCNCDLTTEQLASIERQWRNSELARADIELNKVQDADTKAIGSVSDWRVYRKALRAWPESADFPNKDKHPLAPDA